LHRSLQKPCIAQLSRCVVHTPVPLKMTTSRK
jgi:hypothetical protein